MGTSTVTISANNSGGTGTQTLTITVNSCLTYARVGDTIRITGSNPQASGDLVIPSTIENLPVTEIGYGAFNKCLELTSVTIGSNVTSIGAMAFSSCSGLTNITVTDNNIAYSSRDGVLFNKSQTILVAVPAGKAGNYTIPENVTSIADTAFFGCSTLTNITIPNSVTHLGTYAFAECTAVIGVYFKGNVPMDGFKVFDSSEHITVYFVLGTTGWETTYAGRQVVPSTPPTITSANTVSTTVNRAFTYSITANDTRASFAANDLPPGLSINPITGIISGTPSEQGTRTITISACNAAGMVSQPLALVIYADFSYSRVGNAITIYGLNSRAVRDLIIPDTLDNLPVTTIQDWAFAYCPSLTTVTIGQSVTYISGMAFANSPKIANYTVNDKNLTYSSRDGLLLNKSQTNLVAAPKAISGAFTIPEGVTSIGNGAFESCAGMTSVTFGEGVTYLGKRSFGSCHGLTNVTIPDSVLIIDDLSFVNCAGLTHVTIGESVTFIGQRAFDQSPHLESIYFTGHAPVSFSDSLVASNFGHHTAVLIYFVPTTTGWGKSFSGRPTIPFIPPNPPIVTSDAIAKATIGLPVNHAITANNTPTKFEATGLPPSLTLDPITGVISGIPTTEGSHAITVSAINEFGVGTQTLSLVVVPPTPVLTVHAFATVGQPFRYNITADNKPTGFVAMGLPPGLLLDPLTGVISGIPTGEGTHIVTLSATNTGGTDSQPLKLTVSLPSKIHFDPVRNQVELTSQASAEKPQIVEYTDDFKQWIPLAAKLVGTKDLSQLDPQAATRPFRFYRVIQQ